MLIFGCYAQCRGTEWAARIGTFACRTFHRDTKASKRANFLAAPKENMTNE